MSETETKTDEKPAESPYRTSAKAALRWTVEPEHLTEARRVVDRHALRTPLTPAPQLGPRFWIKWESQQHTGSFKLRGALAKLANLPRVAKKHVVAASAGNHGLGVAWAARALGIRATVFVPANVAEVKRAGIAALGAEVVVTDAEGYDATEVLARAHAEENGLELVSPYDDPFVAAGNGGTVGEEIFDQLVGVDAIVFPVGGGGFLAGLAAARADRDAKLVGVNTDASPGMARSLEQGAAIEELDYAPTLAEGLEGGVSVSTFEAAREADVAMFTVGEDEIAAAMRFARTELAAIVEGSAAVGLAWARDPERVATIPGDGPIVVVVTGKNVDADVLARLERPSA